MRVWSRPLHPLAGEPRDDWNTSLSWVQDIRAQGWWDERIVGGLASYWVYQHLGNLSPESLDSDDLYQSVCAADDRARTKPASTAIPSSLMTISSSVRDLDSGPGNRERAIIGGRREDGKGNVGQFRGLRFR